MFKKYNKSQSFNKLNKDLINFQILKVKKFKNFMSNQEMIFRNIKACLKRFKKLIMQFNQNKIFWMIGFYNNHHKMNNI